MRPLCTLLRAVAASLSVSFHVIHQRQHPRHVWFLSCVVLINRGFAENVRVGHHQLPITGWAHCALQARWKSSVLHRRLHICGGGICQGIRA